MPSHVLLAVDFGESAELGRADAARIARAYAAKLHLVHAEHAVPRSEASSKAQKAHTRELFDAWQRELGALGAHVDSVDLMRGSAAESILDAAKRRDADLIVLGAGDRFDPGTGAERTVETLARFAPQPVWVSRPRARPEISRVLVAFDGSAGARAALDWAAELARRLGATLELAQIFEHPSFVPGTPPSAELEAHAEACRERYALGLSSADLDASSAVQHRAWGFAHQVLSELVQSRAIDLLVLGRTGKGGLRHVFLGSTGELLLRSVGSSLLLAQPAPGS